MDDLNEHFITEPSALAECCEHLATCPLIGFDTEFIGEQTYIPDLCLVQVATPDRLILIDPLSCGPLEAFWRIVADPKKTVVVHAGREEIRFCHFACNEIPQGLFDIQIAAGVLGLGYPLGYGALIQEVLGLRLSKGETLTDWRRRPLTPDQIRYAYDDVRHLLALWKNLQGRLAKLNRLAWLEEELTAFKHRAVVEGPAVEKWRKLKGIGGLDRKRLAVVREIFAWREEKALRVNRPSRFILRDDLIVEAARRNPKTEADMAALRGLNKNDAPAVLEALQRARNLAPDEWPEAIERENDPPQVTLVASLLGAVLADICTRKQITPGLAATTSDIKHLVRARFRGEPPPEESHLTHGWRKEHLLPDLLAFLDGKRGLCVGDIRSETPLAYIESPG